MFGIGPQEFIIVVLIALVIFGPRRLPQMARELGRFASEARRSMNEFKEELGSEEANDGSRDAQEYLDERTPSKDPETRPQKP
jgi:sec-independent protein translocase protein TatB